MASDCLSGVCLLVEESSTRELHKYIGAGYVTGTPETEWVLRRQVSEIKG